VDGSGLDSVVAINDSSVWFELNDHNGHFGSPALWSTSDFSGSRGTFVGAMDGRGFAAPIVMSDTSIWEKPNSTGRPMLGPPQNLSSVPFFGSEGSYLAPLGPSSPANSAIAASDNIWVEANNTSGSLGSPTEWSASLFYGMH
jgi:hypothetical protein